MVPYEQSPWPANGQYHVYPLMFLKRSLPRLPSSFSRSLSSGIIGGGGPACFLGNVLLSSNTLERLDSPPLNSLNQLFRLDFGPPMRLLVPRLGGLLPLSNEVKLPSVKLAFSIFLLNSLRRLPCRAETAGLKGASSAIRLDSMLLPFGDVDLSA